MVNSLKEMISSQVVRFGSLALALSLSLLTLVGQPKAEPTVEPPKSKVDLMASLPMTAYYDSLVAGNSGLVHAKLADLRCELPEDMHDWNYGNVYHHYMILSGLLALYEAKDLELAKKCLSMAGKTPESPQLSSFGPNMLLAKALLEHGEFEVVGEYIDQCHCFWFSGFDRLNEWRSKVDAHEIPDFGANLTY